MVRWTCKAAAAVVGIRPTKATQSLFGSHRAFDKIAMLMIADPEATMNELRIHMRRLLGVRRFESGPMKLAGKVEGL